MAAHGAAVANIVTYYMEGTRWGVVNITQVVSHYIVILSLRYRDSLSSTIPERLDNLRVDKWWLAVNPDSELRRKHP